MRWRPPGAPRPRRKSSPGAAALLILILSFAIFTLGATDAHAGWQALLEPDGRLLCAGRSGLRWAAGIAPDGEGGVLVVTNDQMADPVNPPDGGVDIGLIRLGPDLSSRPIHDGPGGADPCGALLVGGTGWQAAVDVRGWGLGGALVAAWEGSWFGAITDLRTLAQAFDAHGVGLFGAEPIFPTPPDPGSEAPFAAPDDDGGFFLGWTDGPFFDEIAGIVLGGSRIVVQRFGKNGAPLWPEPFRLTAPGSLFNPWTALLAPDGQGGVYVTWSEWRDTDEGRALHMRLQHLSADGVVFVAGGGARIDPVRFVDTGTVLVPVPGGVLAFYRAGAIRMQLFSPRGERQWGSDGRILSDTAALGPIAAPIVSQAPDASLYVTWSNGLPDGRQGVQARRVRRDGTSPWPSPVLLGNEQIGSTSRPQAVLADGSLAVAISGETPDPSRDAFDLDVQVVDQRGRIKAGPHGAPLCHAVGIQSSAQVFAPPAATPPAPGGKEPAVASFFWSDRRPGVGVADSVNFYVQQMRFTTAPRLTAAPIVEARQSESGTIDLEGDDLSPGLTADLGVGVRVTGLQVTAASPDGPGDRLHLEYAIDPAAPVGVHSLRVVNPDGEQASLIAVLHVVLDEQRIDIDRNGRFDGFDLAVLAAAFGRAAGEPGYDSSADFDGSGLVDGADLALLATRFGGESSVSR